MPAGEEEESGGLWSSPGLSGYLSLQEWVRYPPHLPAPGTALGHSLHQRGDSGISYFRGTLISKGICPPQEDPMPYF